MRAGYAYGCRRPNGVISLSDYIPDLRFQISFPRITTSRNRDLENGIASPLHWVRYWVFVKAVSVSMHPGPPSVNRGSGEVSLWGVRIRYLRVSLDESRISRVGDGEDGNGEMGKGGGGG